MRNQMALPMATEWCTVAYAAEKIDVSQRTVRRWIADGTIEGHRVRRGSRESGRGNVILNAQAVEEFARSYKLIKRPAHA